MRNLILLLCIFSSSIHLYSQACDTNSLAIHKVAASTLDSNIPFELARHHSFYNPDCAPQNKLVLFLVGTHGIPSHDLLILKLAANYGYHAISINYPNSQSASISCATDLDTNCYKNFHEEAIFGTDVSDTIQVDTANSIYTRSVNFLNYLATNFSSENWAQFMSGNDIDWSKVIVGGHSQGSGHATYLAHIFPVQRALMFSGPNEYMTNYNKVASWFYEPSMTPDSNHYGFGNINDEFSFENQLSAWETIGLDNYGDTINAASDDCPYNNTRMLYIEDMVSGPITPYHNSTAVDNYVPKDGNGKPLYENVWKYMLGICDTPTSVEESNIYDDISVFPIPGNDFIIIKANQMLTNSKIEVINSLGAVVFKKQYNSLLEEKIQLNYLSRGIYLLSLTNEGNTITKKIILE